MHPVSFRRCLLVACLLSSGSAAVACLWDYDTRAMEEQQFPRTLELITGGFLRHSPEFYEWRIKQRLAEIEQHPDKLELYDDLAVAYEKTGNTPKAISITEELELRDPDRYETLANLGTFYIHNGEFERGLESIDKALEINPDAHFGRERYQKYVVEYLLSKREGDTTKLPLDESDRQISKSFGFTKFLLERLELTTDEEKDFEVTRALKGVLGMMRFGNFDSPVLLECLGDLLLFGRQNSDTPRFEDSARHLASRAYLKASYETDSKEVKSKYKLLAESAGGPIRKPNPSTSSAENISLADLENQFAEELKHADAWIQSVFADEQRWIAEGVDVEAAFDEKYYQAPPPAPDAITETSLSWRMQHPTPGDVKVFLCLFLLMIALYIWRRRSSERRKSQEKQAN